MCNSLHNLQKESQKCIGIGQPAEIYVVVSVFPKWKKIESVVEIGSENELTIQKRLRIGGDCAMLLLPFTVGSGAGWRL